MAKYVVCRDKEDAMTALRAGVLYMHWGGGNWEICRRDTRWLEYEYGWGIWPSRDFAIRVEDEDDNG